MSLNRQRLKEAARRHPDVWNYVLPEEVYGQTALIAWVRGDVEANNLAYEPIDVAFYTTSDYLVKEINNLIVLSKALKLEKLDGKPLSDYRKDMAIEPSGIKVYIIDPDGTEHEVPVTKTGMERTAFDEVIEYINECSNALFAIVY